MWWDKETLLKEAKDALEKRNFEGTSFYLGVANTGIDGVDIKKIWQTLQLVQYTCVAYSN